MKKILISIVTIFAISFFALAEMTVYVYKKDGTKVPYVASAVDSIGFVNVHSITFNPNGGIGSMDVICAKEGESITLPTNSFSLADAKFVGWNTNMDGSGVPYVDKSTIILTANITLYAQWKVSTMANGHEYVDLGLPSGTLWATMNVGAESPEDKGDYFAWGETVPKTKYDWESYKHGSHYIRLKKYINQYEFGFVDYLNFLQPIDDVANVNWGADWRMPTAEEFDELCNSNYCDWIWDKKKKGYIISSKLNDKSIFLPVGGAYYANGLSNTLRGYYWSCSLDLEEPNNAQLLIFDSDTKGHLNPEFRVMCVTVRPVIPKLVTYKVQFNGNGGNGKMNPIEVSYSKQISIPKNTFIRNGYDFAGWNTKPDGTGISYQSGAQFNSVGSDVTLYAQWFTSSVSGFEEEHAYVDLGLPSGTKWATMNVGAISIVEYGDYFAWGEINHKIKYLSDNYKWHDNQSDLIIKYCNDGKTILESVDDAAKINWGGKWTTPSKEQVDELIKYTTYNRVIVNGVVGYTVCSNINNNCIFIPAAGKCSSKVNYSKTSARYWCSDYRDSPSCLTSYYWTINGNTYAVPTESRYVGLSIRPVMK